MTSALDNVFALYKRNSFPLGSTLFQNYQSINLARLPILISMTAHNSELFPYVLFHSSPLSLSLNHFPKLQVKLIERNFAHAKVCLKFH